MGQCWSTSYLLPKGRGHIMRWRRRTFQDCTGFTMGCLGEELMAGMGKNLGDLRKCGEKRLNKGIKRAYNINSCLWVYLCGHALYLKNAVCPILLNSFPTLSWVRDSLFCVHVCVRGSGCTNGSQIQWLEGVCLWCSNRRMCSHLLSVWAVAKISPD